MKTSLGYRKGYLFSYDPQKSFITVMPEANLIKNKWHNLQQYLLFIIQILIAVSILSGAKCL
jgi:hypothetical protein